MLSSVQAYYELVVSRLNRLVVISFKYKNKTTEVISNLKNALHHKLLFLILNGYVRLLNTSKDDEAQ